MQIETPADRLVRKKAFLLTHPISGGLDDDQNNLDHPPDTPPGNPSDSPETKPDAPAAIAAPAAPSFTPEQISAIATGISSGLRDGLFPKNDSPSPDAPSGPTAAELQAKIDELDNQIDLAVQESKPIGALQRKRDEYRDQKFEIERVAPLRSQGSSSINALNIDRVENNPKFKMVFDRYGKEIKELLTPAMRQGQVLTLEIVENAAAYVRGKHYDELKAFEAEEEIRKAKLNDSAPMPGQTNGRNRSTQPRTPDTVRERFGAGGDEAFNAKRNKGYTEDTFARRLGFKDKADWFAEDDAMSRPDFTIGLDSVWDRKNQRWVTPDEINEFYNA